MVFIYGMGWLDVRLGSFTPSLVVLIALLAANCLVFMRLEEIPLHSPRVATE